MIGPIKFLRQKHRKYVTDTYIKIDVKSGACRFNNRCHMNSVHEAIENKDNRVALVMSIEQCDDALPIIHYLNYSSGEYIDNTLGNWSEIYDYYHVKFINKSEFFTVSKELLKQRKFLKKEVHNILERVIIPIEC